MGLFAKLFGKRRQRKTARVVRRSYVLTGAAARRLMDESKAIAERARRMGAKKPSAADRAKTASPGHIMLVRGVRYRWTLRFTRARGGKLTESQIEKLIDETKADADTLKLRVHQRNPLVLSFTSASGQPVTTEAPIGATRPVQSMPGVVETTLRVVEA
jgi:hypothetical protein